MARVTVSIGWLWAVAKPWWILSPCLGLFSLPGGPLDVCSDKTSFDRNGVLREGEGLVILLCLGPRLGLLGDGDPRFLRWLAGGLIF